MSKLTINSIYSNFQLKEQEYIEDIQATYNYFEHKNLGTKLIHIKNDDKEKFFSISFKTPANNSTGIQHILEHSVLRGSKKYNYGKDEVFTKVIKSSILTFINAMTYPDKTVYPFSTMFESEFYKVMDVYLDAVLFPILLQDINFFRQEGWRYEKDQNGNIIYNGVVFNEMKGRLSDPMVLDEEYKISNLFYDTQYRHNTGGNPNVIPSLTYKEFTDYHKKYYHPSNAIIVLYGDMDISKTLEKIENDFFVNFNKSTTSEDILLQKKFSSEKYIDNFYLSQDEDRASIFSISFLIERIDLIKENFAVKILIELLVSKESSLLRKRILDTKLVKSFHGYMEEDLQQCFVSFVFEGVDDKDINTLENVFYAALYEIVEQKFDHEYIESILKHMEHSIRLEKFSTARGLKLMNTVLRHQLHDFSPISSFEKIANLNWVKKEYKKGLFENFILKYLLNNNSRVISKLHGKKDINPYQSLDDKLKELNSKKIVPKEIDESINEFINYQNEESIPVETTKILPPKIDMMDSHIVNDIRPEEHDGVLYFYNKINDKNIENCFLSFDVALQNVEKIQYLKFLEKLLPKAKVEGLTQDKTEMLIDNLFGEFDFSVKIGNDMNFSVYSSFNIFISYLLNDKNKVFDFMNTFIKDIDFDHSLAMQTIDEEIQNFKSSFAFRGNTIGVLRAGAKFSAAGMLNDKVSGYEYYIFLHDLKKKFMANPNEEVQNFKNTFKSIINKNNISIAITSNEPDFNIHNKFSLPEEKNIDIVFNPVITNTKDEAIVLNSLENSFNILASDLSSLNIKFDNKFMFLANLLSYDYLWEAIREKGGAYGSYAVFDKNSDLFFLTSYMDSRIEGTYKDYYQIADFINNIHLTDSELQGLIAKSITPLVAPVNQLEHARNSLLNYKNGEKYNRKSEMFKDIVSITHEDIPFFQKTITSLLENSVKVTLCSSKKMNNEKKLFEKVTNVI